MRNLCLLCILGMLALTRVLAAEEKPSHALLDAKELADGWVMLYDGESTSGWDAKQIAGVNQFGNLALAPSQEVSLSTTGLLGTGKLRITYTSEKECGIVAEGVKTALRTANQLTKVDFDFQPDRPSRLTLHAPEGATLVIHALAYQVSKTQPLLDGKTLDGWKVFDTDPKRNLSKWNALKDGTLHLTNGPGDLQTVGKYADFALQLECKTNGQSLNSGVFFRCIDGQYQNGYECQIHNGVKDGKPADFGTGAIYRRQPARKIVAKDQEWFHLTLIAVGPTFSTYVNGYPTLVWTDERAKDENPRKGLRLQAGHISLQGHDPTTDIHFRNLRIADWKMK